MEGKEVVYRGGIQIGAGDVVAKGRVNAEASFRLDIQALDISRRNKKE
jgi:hypothetical protein